MSIQDLIISILCSVMISLGVGYFAYDYLQKQQPTPQQVAVIDIQQIVQDFVITLAHKNLPDAQIETEVQAFTDELNTVMQNLATKNNFVVVAKSATVSGGIDLTDVYKSYTKGGK